MAVQAVRGSGSWFWYLASWRGLPAHQVLLAGELGAVSTGHSCARQAGPACASFGAWWLVMFRSHASPKWQDFRVTAHSEAANA